MCVWGRGAAFSFWVQYEDATSRAPSDRENAPLGMAVAFEAVRSGSRAIYLDRGLCGYVFARSCRAQNTILLASSQKAPILPSSLTKHVLALPIHPNRRPSPAPCVVCTSWATPMPVGGAVRPSYRTLRSVGGQQEAAAGKVEQISLWMCGFGVSFTTDRSN